MQPPPISSRNLTLAAFNPTPNWAYQLPNWCDTINPATQLANIWSIFPARLPACSKVSILSADEIWRCISSKTKQKVDSETNEVHQRCSWAFSKSCRRVNINCPQRKKVTHTGNMEQKRCKVIENRQQVMHLRVWDAFPLVIWLPLWSHAGHVCPREARAIIPDNFPPFPLYPLFPPPSPVFSPGSRQLQPDNLHCAALLRPLCTICSWPHLPGQLWPFFPFIRKKRRRG